MSYQTINPASGEVLQSFPDIADAALEAVLANAASVYETWRHKSYAERAKIIAKAAALLHEQAEAFAHTMTLEMGKRISEARGEVEFSSRILAYYAKNAETFLAPVKLHPTRGIWKAARSALFSVSSPGTFHTTSSHASLARI
jgi:succinate-semialdehyde dehydrogenase/glutarate-semialdehyde dehydrogenase